MKSHLGLSSAQPFNCQSHPSIMQCHNFKNCSFYKVLYGEQANLACSVCVPYKTFQNYNFQIDGTSRYFGV